MPETKIEKCRVCSRFYRFCEETSFNGLNHVAHTHSRPFQLFWLVCFLLSAIIVVILFGATIYKYLSHPTGIDQEFLSTPISLPPLSICVPSIWLSKTAIQRLNISEGLTSVLQWRLESQFFLGFHEDFYQHIPALLNETRAEYEALMARLGLGSDFFNLMSLLVPLPLSRTGVVRVHYMISDSDDTGFSAFYCTLITSLDTAKVFERLAFSSISEISTVGLSSVAKMQLIYARSIYLVSKFDLRTIITISPGSIYSIKYTQRTTRLINTADHPCDQANEDGQDISCEQRCYEKLLWDSFPGCRHCQAQYHRLIHHENIMKTINDTGDNEGPEAKMNKKKHLDSVFGNIKTLTHLCDPWEFWHCEHYLNIPLFTKINTEHERCKDLCLPKCTHVAHTYAYTVQTGEDLIGVEVEEKTHSTLVIAPEKGPQRNVLIHQYPVMDIASVFSSFGGYLGLFLGSSVLTIVHVVAFSLRSTSLAICAACRGKGL